MRTSSLIHEELSMRGRLMVFARPEIFKFSKFIVVGVVMLMCSIAFLAT
jgi:hypothetical protein